MKHLKLIVLGLSLSSPAFAGELCKIAAEPDDSGNNVCDGSSGHRSGGGGGGGGNSTTTTTDTGQITLEGSIDLGAAKGSWKIRGPSIVTTTTTTGGSPDAGTTDGGSK